MSTTSHNHRHHVAVFATAFACMVACGCALFNRPIEVEHDVRRAEPITREAIALEIAVAGNTTDASLVRMLWSEVDEMGVMKPTLRRHLNNNGFRIGAGATPPSALEAILKRGVDQQRFNQADMTKSGQLPGSKSITLFHGQDTLVEASQIIPNLDFVGLIEDAQQSSEDEIGEGIAQEFQQAKCLFRITAEKVQDGWIKLRFLPEVHFGGTGPRAVLTATSVQVRDQQRVKPLYQYQFEVTLNPGEVAILGAAESDQQRPGYQFFNAGSDEAANRLVAIRFLSIQRIEGKRDTTAQITKR